MEGLHIFHRSEADSRIANNSETKTQLRRSVSGQYKIQEQAQKQIFLLMQADETESSPYSATFQQLYSANPILPPDKHKGQLDGSIRYRYLVESQHKMNRTSFPQVRARNWLNQTQAQLGNPKAILSARQIEEEQEGHGEEAGDEEIGEQLQGRALVYARFNNRKWNRLDREKQTHYCSIFINTKKQQLKSKKTPIYQFLAATQKQPAPEPARDDLLNFQSSFESGNLLYAHRCLQEPIPTYELYMQNDTNTKGCTQWFYFKAVASKRIKVRLRVMNFYKPTSLYMNGMKVLVSNDCVEWKRVGTAIRYSRVDLGEGRESYMLEFMYDMEHVQKTYYFAYGYPYTLSQLENVLSHYCMAPGFSRIASKVSLCQSYLGNNISMLTITNQIRSKTSQARPIIYVVGRQHPGETPSSYIMEGVLRMLLSSKCEMEELRESFIIKVVPMLNVDGVVNGNYRSNFSGSDVNRQWQAPSKKLHPEVYYLKQQIVGNKKNAHFFLDIHAHSRKMNSFFYGSKCIGFDNRLYPFVCSKLNKNINYQESSFLDDPAKRTTARVVLQNQAAIKKSLTFQVSFYGSEDGAKKTKTHFKQEDLRSIGQCLALGLYYSQIGVDKYSSKQAIDAKIKKDEDTGNSKASTSWHVGSIDKKSKKAETVMKIGRNCEKIMEKWKKQLEKLMKQLNEDVLSEGSSIDPQHFQLTASEQDRIVDYLHFRSGGQLDQGTINQGHIDGSQAYQKNQADLMMSSRFQAPETDTRKQKDAKILVFPAESNLRSSMLVKKLESELQMQRTHRRFVSLAPKRQGQGQARRGYRLQNSLVEGKKFQGIVAEQKQINAYRNNILEIKKALRYFIDNKSYDYKSSDYEDYKNYLRYASAGTAVLMPDNQSIGRTKNKYSKI